MLDVREEWDEGNEIPAGCPLFNQSVKDKCLFFFISLILKQHLWSTYEASEAHQSPRSSTQDSGLTFGGNEEDHPEDSRVHDSPQEFHGEENSRYDCFKVFECAEYSQKLFHLFS